VKRFLFALSLAVLGLWAMSATVAGEPAARLATYEKASGEKFFALSLAPVEGKEPAQAVEVVLLVDTSASQAGRFRDDTIAALREMIIQFPATFKVKLIAVDTKPVALNADFAEPRGKEMKAAYAKLMDRLPLGATDLPGGLAAAMSSFAADSTAARHVIYFGDGMSKANLLTQQNFEPLIRNLVEKKISVSSYAIGGDRNASILAAIANQTGGNIFIDNDDPQSPANAAATLVKTLGGQVVWPTSVKLPPALTQSYPATLPPLRNDRDTIVIGRLDGAGAMDISVAGSKLGKPVSFAWKVTPEVSKDEFSYLPQMVEVARKDKGLSLPTLGSQGLVEAARVQQTSADNLADLGKRTLEAGNFDGARQVAQAVLDRDPQNPTGVALMKAAKNPQAAKPATEGGGGAAPGSSTELKLVKTKNQNAPPPVSAFPEGQPGFLDTVAQEREVLARKIEQQVQLAVKDAQAMMVQNPSAAINGLKEELAKIQLAPELDANTRLALQRSVENSIREAERLQVIHDREQAELDEQRATATELSRINESLDRKNIKMKQIMDRFDALMDEGKYKVATDEVLPEVLELEPDKPMSTVAKWSGRNQRAVRELNAIWDARERGYHEVMMLIEKAQIPFPDEPPITYTDPEKWLDITLRRQKYKSVDLAKSGSSEAKILEALKETTSCEFFETPLKDIAAYFSEVHGIPIFLDTARLADVQITSDTPNRDPITLKGISLRSALRLILKEHGLTYMIKDEVLQITTKEEAEKPENLIRKVYPVGDLVVPIRLNTNLFGIGGSGLGGGGLGGLGGQNGGGFGGGGQGGQFGGGGGGQFGGGGGGIFQ
jgi:hypothetical protein